MMNELIRLLGREKTTKEGIQAWQKASGPLTVTGLSGSIKAGFLCALQTFGKASDPLIILTPRREDVRLLRRELTPFYPDQAMRELYPLGLIHGEIDTRNEEVMAERAAALEMILKKEAAIIFVTAEAAIQKLPRPDGLLRDSITLTHGDEKNRDKLIERLVKEGYERTDQVETLGQFSVRGDILDIFPINAKDPVRIEWFDETIDAIRRFSLEDQRSIGGLTKVDIMPIASGEKEAESSLLDYVSPDQLLVLDEASAFFEEAKKSYLDNREFKDQLFSEKELLERSQKSHLLVVSALSQPLYQAYPRLAIKVRAAAPYNRSWDLLIKDLKGWIKEGIHPLIMMGTRDKAFGTAQHLQNEGLPMTFVQKGSLIPEKGGAVFEGGLSHGFHFWDENWLLLTEADIFGSRKERRQKKKIRGAGPALTYFTDIKAGDYVVHDTQGIGRYLGVETIVIDGIHRDYLKLQYAQGDKLHVPVEQVGLLHKYIGSEGTPPRLSRMGRSDWQKAKKKAQKAITILASELLRLYAQRKITPGHAFAPDTPWQKEFEDRFPFEETPDQLKAIQEIKADMEKPVPMERLLCGDVGYGKTEVGSFQSGHGRQAGGCHGPDDGSCPAASHHLSKPHGCLWCKN